MNAGTLFSSTWTLDRNRLFAVLIGDEVVHAGIADPSAVEVTAYEDNAVRGGSRRTPISGELFAKSRCHMAPIAPAVAARRGSLDEDAVGVDAVFLRVLRTWTIAADTSVSGRGKNDCG